MSKLSIHLPSSFRLDIKLVKSRTKEVHEPILPDLAKILRIRKGSRLSRFFRHIFEHNRIKKILGHFMIITFIFSNLIVPRVYASPKVDSDIDISGQQSKIAIKTEKSKQYPLKNIRITQHYRFYHRAIDFDGITGEPIFPITEGEIIKIDRSYWGYGNSVLIEHKSGSRSLYAHLSKINVKTGDEVNKETVIGEVGNTGRSFGDHLHLEVYDEEGRNVNPLEFISG